MKNLQNHTEEAKQIRVKDYGKGKSIQWQGVYPPKEPIACICHCHHAEWCTKHNTNVCLKDRECIHCTPLKGDWKEEMKDMMMEGALPFVDYEKKSVHPAKLIDFIESLLQQEELKHCACVFRKPDNEQDTDLLIESCKFHSNQLQQNRQRIVQKLENTGAEFAVPDGKAYIALDKVIEIVNNREENK
jgi:hypothetical protein